MNLKSKTVSPRRFWLCVAAYVLISYLAFLFSTGGYLFVFYFYIFGAFYFVVLFVLTLVCSLSKSVKYSPILSYLILGIQTVAIVLNVSDGGYYGLSCGQNFVQRFFDRDSSCGGLWLSLEAFLVILFLYVVLVAIFMFDVLRLKSVPGKD